jgi:hypothetical protein
MKENLLAAFGFMIARTAIALVERRPVSAGMIDQYCFLSLECRLTMATDAG